jgi:hypothetical protein
MRCQRLKLSTGIFALSGTRKKTAALFATGELRKDARHSAVVSMLRKPGRLYKKSLPKVGIEL